MENLSTKRDKIIKSLFQNELSNIQEELDAIKEAGTNPENVCAQINWDAKDLEGKTKEEVDIINTTKKDDVITGDECFIYKNPDGTLKKMDINGISEMIYKKIEKHLISDHDKTQDTNIKNIKHTVNDINNINIWKNFNGKK